MAPTKKNYAKVKVWGERITSTLEGPLMGVIVQMFTSVPTDNHEYLLKKLQVTSDDIRGIVPAEPARPASKTEFPHTAGLLTIGKYATTVIAADGFPLADVDETPVLQSWEELGIGHWSEAPGKAFIERSEAEAEANARRIVATWNACDGIPTEALACQTKMELTAQLIEINKDLLAAVTLLMDPVINAYAHQDQLGDKCACQDCTRSKARAAIGKAVRWQP